MAKVVRSETQDVRRKSSSGRVVQPPSYYRRGFPRSDEIHEADEPSAQAPNG